MKTIWKSSLLVTTIALLAGCADIPQEAVDSATLAIEDARERNADVFAADLFAAAQDSFEAARTEIDLQQSKIAFLRGYDRAEILLASATQMASEATDEAIARKEEMRTETQALLSEAKQVSLNASMLLDKAPTGKEGRIALASISTDIDSLDVTFGQIEIMLANDDVLSANESARAALLQAENLTRELQTAIDKTSARRRG